MHLYVLGKARDRLEPTKYALDAEQSLNLARDSRNEPSPPAQVLSGGQLRRIARHLLAGRPRLKGRVVDPPLWPCVYLTP